jgi:bifunctional non-homologous end joining protein LigD
VAGTLFTEEMNGTREVRGVPVSDPDKVFFPGAGITKGEIAEYYGRVAEVMLPHVRDRCISMHRWPDGIEGDDFYQKEAPGYFPEWIRTETVPKKGDGSVRHVVADDARTLVYLADQGCLTPHVWLSRTERPDHPDRMVFDLDPSGDPATPSSVQDLRWAARNLGRLLEELALSPKIMTSGSRGFHLHVSLDGSADFDATRGFARRVSEMLAARHPDRLTTAQRKKERRGRIFLDYLRNGYAQTSVPPYAVRARPGAPVATPVEWDELSGIRPQRYTVRNLFRRLGQKADPWEDPDDDSSGLAGPLKKLDELEQDEPVGDEPERTGGGTGP